MEREHREEEKMFSAIQQGAGRKAIEAVRDDSSMQMKTILAELNMEQFRRVPLYESYMADEITEEQYRAEVLDYEEAHGNHGKYDGMGTGIEFAKSVDSADGTI